MHRDSKLHRTTIMKIPAGATAYIGPPAQVLVIVLEENSTSTHAKIKEVLRATLPTNFYLDSTESRPGDPGLPNIRATGTQLNLNHKLNQTF
jgi:hypothetical protein